MYVQEIGTDLHDDLIQKLSSFRLSIDGLQRSFNNPDEVVRLATKMQAEFLTIVDSIRRTSRKLAPVGQQGDSLQSAIRFLCTSMEYPGVAQIHLATEGEEIWLTARDSRYLQRMVQELIHNAFRHSSAWHVWVDLRHSAENVIIVVEDDGLSSSPKSESIKRLRDKWNTLRMRATVIGAALSYEAGSKGGLRVTITYPISVAGSQSRPLR